METMDIGEPSENQSRCSDSKTDRISTHPFSQTSNSKLKTPKPAADKVSLEDMKDEYSCNFYKNIDVDEQFLIENEQHVIDGVDLCKNLSEYEQGETEVLVKGIKVQTKCFVFGKNRDRFQSVRDNFTRVQDTIF